MSKHKPNDSKYGKVVGHGIIFGDVHDPYCDDVVWEELFLPAVKVIKPKFIIENGDGFDAYPLSRFLKDPMRKMSLASDRDCFVARRKRLRKMLPADCKMTYIPGNHEKWIHKYLWSKAEELAGLSELQWHQFLRLNEIGYAWLDFNGEQQPIMELGKLGITHGELSRKPLGATIRAMLDEYGCNVLFNHTHRMGWLTMTNYNTNIAGWENGCLCRRELGHEYIRGAVRWQQGFSVVTLYEGGYFRVHPVQVLEHDSCKIICLHEFALVTLEAKSK